MGTQLWTVFNYRYRDAGNFKSHGQIWLRGTLSEHRHFDFCSRLEAGEFFVAEQVGIPTLYADLYQWSSGKSIQDDHCWHEFVGFSETETLPEGAAIWGSVLHFVQKFNAVDEWDGSLSVHFAIG